SGGAGPGRAWHTHPVRHRLRGTVPAVWPRRHGTGRQAVPARRPRGGLAAGAWAGARRAMNTARARQRRAWPAALHLAVFAIIIALPLLGVLGLLLHRSAQQERLRLEHVIDQKLDTLVASIDRDIERRVA